MNPTGWAEVDRRRRRRVILGTAIALAATWVLLIGIYYLVPFTNRTASKSLVRLILGIAAFVLVLLWQLHGIRRADFPVLRAVQALGVVIPVFLLVFSILYLSLSQDAATDFSEPLNHTGALYLTVTVFSTVGFGDITPKGDLARIVVSVQMLLDLVVIGAVVRLITSAATTGRRDSDSSVVSPTDADSQAGSRRSSS